MNLLRILVLSALFYLLFRLLFGDRRKPDEPAASPAQDTLVEDPVCHTYVPRSQAVSATVQGRTVHFCSNACRTVFLDHQKNTANHQQDLK